MGRKARKMSDEKLFTQDEVNALVGEARIKARETKAKEYEGWISPDDMTSRMAELTDALNSANEKLKENENLMAEKDKSIKAYELSSVKTQIAHETGLSWDAINFLQGDSEEAIRKSAESLKTLVGKHNVPPMANPEKPVGDSTTEAFRGMLNDLGGNL